MTQLFIIYGTELTAIELYCGDDVKYVETFSNWNALLNTLSEHMRHYAEIRLITPKQWEWIVKGI